MSRRLAPLTRLAGEQLGASDPRVHAALSASAGTGKTHVLTARVLRLLLSRVRPESILCLTFTKAGAAEMADRIHARLAYWVRLKDDLLGAELAALGESSGPAKRAEARTLFAGLLDAPGGGLRIQTIHAFAQGLLTAFPAEAGLTPGFRAMEGREQGQLARQVLADLLVRAEGEGDSGLIRDIQALSRRLGEEGAERFMMDCARAPQAMADIGPREGIEARLRLAFGLPLGDIEAAIAAECGGDGFDLGALARIGAMNQAWGTKSGLQRASLCEQWAAADADGRAALLDDLHRIWAKGDGDVRSFGKGQAPPDADYGELATAAFECCARLLAMRKAAALVALYAAGLRSGQAFALAYGDTKRGAGLADFDDLIRWAEALLAEPGMGDWVRFKLDQSIDHILVDEAQDTNARQWSIVGALAGEFFAGEGARSRHRTIFTVGDFKQAIFRFQGTDPREFERARAHFEAQAVALREAAIQLEVETPPFRDLSMDTSFRSSPAILEVVDRVAADLGPGALGLPRAPRPHRAHHRGRAGSVILWRAYREEDEAEDAGDENWVSDSMRRYAGRLARQVRRWIDRPFAIESGGKPRPVRPEDILILVRKRSTLAALIVARLHAEGVPVAGIDRLLLSAPLAVQDLLAAIRFAVQPLDDLNLASLLVSPLFGWSQEELFEAAHERKGPLWPHLRGQPMPEATREGLGAILAMADYATPHQFLETILSGPINGRRRLIERLGPEARDPIEELLSGALEFESNAIPSLQRFLDWFARGDVEIVRDPSAPLDAVRVMTVHGSKGLQAPVVILADATVDPTRSPGGAAKLDVPGLEEAVPLFRPRKAEMAEPIASGIAREDRFDREEHWRLLYVAMTRAEHRLYVGGALGPADCGVPAEASWYAAIRRSLDGLESVETEDDLWGAALRFGSTPSPIPRREARGMAKAGPLPEWLHRQAPVEARPPRPLAPSALGEDDEALPPPGPAMRAAAERGRLLHRLFERLPAIAPWKREAAAEAWLRDGAGVEDAGLRAALVRDACAIVSDPAHADLFGPEALAEAPIAAVIPGGSVVAGTVDRLLIEDDRVRLVDFKTGRRVPGGADQAPSGHIRQMAAYAEALRVIFPGRTIEAALLYTSGPVLHRLSPALLAAHLPATG